MSTGIVHYAAAKKVEWGLIVGSVVLATMISPLCLGVALGGLVGVWITPDLDLAESPKMIFPQWKYRQKHRLLGWLWWRYWYLYGRIFRHRGASHWPLVGTLTRLVYGFWWIYVLLDLYAPGALAAPWGLFWLSLLAGWMFQDLIHWCMDYL